MGRLGAFRFARTIKIEFDLAPEKLAAADTEKLQTRALIWLAR